jgi:flagellar hook-associated protein FlgK
LTINVNGTNYTTAALGPGATISTMAAAIQAAIPANFTATVNGGNIQIQDQTGILANAGPITVTGTGTETFGAGVQTSPYSASIDSSGNIAIADSTGNPITLSLSLLSGTGTEIFAPAKYSTLSASAAGGTVVITDTSGNPPSVNMTTQPMFTAGTPVAGNPLIPTPSTIDFAQTSSSLNIGQTFDVTVDGTDYGSTTPLTTGSITLTDVAAGIQNVFTTAGVAYTAAVVGGKIQISDPAGNPITANITLNGGVGSEALSLNTTTSPLNTLNSGLGVTNDANHFFAAVNIASGVDNSATIQVNPSLLANTSLLLNGASGPDPSISQNLLINLGNNYTFAAAGSFTNSTTTTIANYSGQIIGQTASAAAAATANATFQSQLQSQLATQAGSVSGVNIDEELSNLIQYQNTYSANAKVMNVIQTLYDTLMKM